MTSYIDRERLKIQRENEKNSVTNVRKAEDIREYQKSRSRLKNAARAYKKAKHDLNEAKKNTKINYNGLRKFDQLNENLIKARNRYYLLMNTHKLQACIRYSGALTEEGKMYLKSMNLQEVVDTSLRAMDSAIAYDSNKGTFEVKDKELEKTFFEDQNPTGGKVQNEYLGSTNEPFVHDIYLGLADVDKLVKSFQDAIKDSQKKNPNKSTRLRLTIMTDKFGNIVYGTRNQASQQRRERNYRELHKKEDK